MGACDFANNAELRSQEERCAMTTSQPFNAFLRYVNAASPSRRSSEVKRLRAESESDYDPRVDYWKRFRDAVATDLRTRCDGAAVRRAAENATATRRANYTAAAAKWLDVVGRWGDCEYVSPSREVLTLGGLEITVNPIAIERHPDGSSEVIALWLRADMPSADTVAAALALLSTAYPVHVPVLVDLQRSALHHDTKRRPDSLRTWLAGEAAGLAHLLSAAAA